MLRRKDARLGWPDYRTARLHLEVACQCAERFRGKFRDQGERHRVLAEAYGVFELHVRNCVEVWEVSVQEGQPDVGVLRRAVWAAEASRSRQLLDKVVQAQLVPVLAPVKLQAKYARLVEQLERTQMRLELGERGGQTALRASSAGVGGLAGVAPVPQAGGIPGSRACGSALEGLLKLLRQQEQEMASVLERIKAHDPLFDPQQGVRSIACETIEALIPPEPRTAFVLYALGREQSVAFVLPGQGEIRPVPLPELRVGDMDRLRADWFEAYSRWRGKRLSAEEQVQEWENHMRPLLGRLGAAALVPLRSALPKRLKRLVISPHQSLHVFPMHACPLGNDGLWGDEFEIVYTPSFSMLQRCTQLRRNGGGGALVVECPDGVSGRRLPFAEAECVALRRRLGRARRLSGVKATANALAAAGRECGLLHYSGHAEFNPKEPLKSKLMLTGEPLTLGQVFGGMRLHRNRLVVLSGCESGLLVPDVLDDYWSFTTGFLYAGAQSVVSALWEIPDLPSAMLMNKFYAFWLGGKPAAGALQEAQRWLRTLRRGDEFDGAVEALTRNLEDRTMARQCSKAAAKYVAALGEHPYACPIHWAAFTCSGAGYGQPGMRQ